MCEQAAAQLVNPRSWPPVSVDALIKLKAAILLVNASGSLGRKSPLASSPRLHCMVNVRKLD